LDLKHILAFTCPQSEPFSAILTSPFVDDNSVVLFTQSKTLGASLVHPISISHKVKFYCFDFKIDSHSSYFSDFSLLSAKPETSSSSLARISELWVTIFYPCIPGISSLSRRMMILEYKQLYHFFAQNSPVDPSLLI
jgi:hypothetical protein